MENEIIIEKIQKTNTTLNNDFHTISKCQSILEKSNFFPIESDSICNSAKTTPVHISAQSRNVKFDKASHEESPIESNRTCVDKEKFNLNIEGLHVEPLYESKTPSKEQTSGEINESTNSAPKAVFVSDLISSVLSIKSIQNSILFEDDIIYFKNDSLSLSLPSASSQNNNLNKTTNFINSSTNAIDSTNLSTKEPSVSVLIDSLFNNCLNKTTNQISLILKWKSICLAIIFIKTVQRNLREKSLISSLPTIKFIDEENIFSKDENNDSIDLTPYFSKSRNIRKCVSTYCMLNKFDYSSWSFLNKNLNIEKCSLVNDDENNEEIEKNLANHHLTINPYNNHNDSIFSNYYNSINNTNTFNNSIRYVKTPNKRLIFDSIDLKTTPNSMNSAKFKNKKSFSSKSTPSINTIHQNNKDQSLEKNNDDNNHNDDDDQLLIKDEYKNCKYYYIKKSELRYISNKNETLNKQMTPLLITSLSKQQLNMENFSLNGAAIINVDSTNMILKDTSSIKTIQNDDLVEFKLANRNLNEIISSNLIIDEETYDKKAPVQNCIQNLLFLLRAFYSKVFNSNRKQNLNSPNSVIFLTEKNVRKTNA